MNNSNKRKLIISSNTPYHKMIDSKVLEAGVPLKTNNRKIPLSKGSDNNAKKQNTQPKNMARKPLNSELSQSIPVHVGYSYNHSWDNDRVVGEQIDVESMQGQNPLEQNYFDEHGRKIVVQPEDVAPTDQEEVYIDEEYQVQHDISDNNILNLQESEYCVLVHGDIILVNEDFNIINSCIKDLINNYEDIEINDLMVIKRLKLKYDIVIG